MEIQQQNIYLLVQSIRTKKMLLLEVSSPQHTNQIRIFSFTLPKCNANTYIYYSTKSKLVRNTKSEKLVGTVSEIVVDRYCEIGESSLVLAVNICV